MVEAADGTVIAREGPDCAVPASPASTFKVALALIGFDSGILEGPHAPAWPYREEYDAPLESWKRTIDPSAWLAESVIWYSQELTRRLGMARFQAYVDRLDYGNRDLSGNPGKHDGLTRAWLSSSLKITPVAQAALLRRLLAGTLPVSTAAQEKTRATMTPAGPVAGWAVRGKTGTGFQPGADGTPDRSRPFGWYVGWAEKDGRALVFVHLLKDGPGDDGSPAGPRARAALLERLERLLPAL
ncbi:class D beta-lactamase [Rhodospirillum centenum]|uniref:class D beta-lactamase n=1 Tax=Rhodospirillum centenum TaxID=34018 RepID=UPI0003180246|nr:class D beta-lactamase [Rhodospirillum centenum]